MGTSGKQLTVSSLLPQELIIKVLKMSSNEVVKNEGMSKLNYIFQSQEDSSQSLEVVQLLFTEKNTIPEEPTLADCVVIILTNNSNHIVFN